jgi:toxin FitB
MIVLDTNVVSEPMKAEANPAVAAWLDRQAVETLYLTAVSLAELLVGVEILPAGKRRHGIGAALGELVSTLFGPRVLPFDQEAAKAYAILVARARTAGHVISVSDGQIAAIATANGFIVATRDVAPFLAAGVPVINPWRTDEG